MTRSLPTSIKIWADDATALMRTCSILARDFGTRAESRLLEKTLAWPRQWVAALVAVASGTPEPTLAKHSGPFPRYECSDVLAELLTPSLRALVEPVPSFVEEARRERDANMRRAIIRHYGSCIGYIGMYVCSPLWGQFPRLAPSGWRGAERASE
jgi:hypothetical protein